jgi:hypothetical protein
VKHEGAEPSKLLLVNGTFRVKRGIRSSYLYRGFLGLDTSSHCFPSASREPKDFQLKIPFTSRSVLVTGNCE